VAVLLSLTLGCYPEEFNEGGVCVSSETRGDQLLLVVEASSRDCASDHKGANFECSITTDGATATVKTVFEDGKDPNDACAGPLRTTCEVVVEAGSYTIEFADEQGLIMVPDGTPLCLGGGTSFDDDTTG
jgi:hypothetical protein